MKHKELRVVDDDKDLIEKTDIRISLNNELN
jgi:hypothetical protein